MSKDVPISDDYRTTLWQAMIVSGIIAILGILTLDDDTPRLTAIGILVFWAIIVVVIWRRPQNPTSFDLLLIRWGCLPLVLGFQIAIHFIWHWRGLE